MKKKKRPARKYTWMGRFYRRGEKRILVQWVRFARRHRESNILPVMLFLVIFSDAFIVVMPSMLCLAVSVTISPRRWFVFAGIFVAAYSANHLATYGVGRFFPAEQVHAGLEVLRLDPLWDSALDAILDYGVYATFIGSVVSLPTQIITLMIGMADSDGSNLVEGVRRASISWALVFAAFGQGIKAFLFSGLVRYGWIKLERKIEKQSSLDLGPSGLGSRSN